MMFQSLMQWVNTPSLNPYGEKEMTVSGAEGRVPEQGEHHYRGPNILIDCSTQLLAHFLSKK